MNEWFTNPLFWITFLSLQSVAAAVIFLFGRVWPKTSAGLTMAGGLGGIAALLLSLHLIPIEDIVLVDRNEYVYEKLSIHILFLEMIFLVIGLLIAVLSIIGYQSIRDAAIKNATDAANQKLEKWEYLFGGPRPGGPRPGGPDLGELRPSDYQIQPKPEEDTL